MPDFSEFANDLKVMAGLLNNTVRRLPGLVGAEVLESIDQNFRSESFFGQAWEPRKVEKGNDGRAILVQTGRLRRSFKLENSGLTITIFTDVPYAEIHNEGGIISGTANVAEYTRNQYEMNEVSKPGSKKEKWKKETTGSHTVRAHTREVNLTIPQRQFMGEHPELDNRIKTLLVNEISPIFDK